MCKKRFFVFFVLLNIASVCFPNEKQAQETQKKTICLNMIVKDEKEVIERCLASVKPIIDYWVIFDTGSTDGTQEIIKTCLKDIPGELHQSAWVNFSHNRNEALQAAKGKGDYLLFVDADEVFHYEKEFDLSNLNEDYYYVTLRQLNAGDAKRIELVNNHLEWKWEGVIHETPVCKEAKTGALLPGVVNVTNTPGAQGARAKDPKRGIKDAEILEKALLDEPNNSRYIHYLGISYLSANEYELAKKQFLKRVSIENVDSQETYLSQYYLGVCYEKLEEYDKALSSYFKAFERKTNRAEPLFKAAVIYRKLGNPLLGYLISKFALSFSYPREDACVEYMVYDHALLIEFTNCALLTGRFEEGEEACLKLLSNPNLPENIKPNVISNLTLAHQNNKMRAELKLQEEKTIK